MAKRAVFTFYVLAVLRACKMLMLASDHGPVCRPDPVAYQKGYTGAACSPSNEHRGRTRVNSSPEASLVNV